MTNTISQATIDSLHNSLDLNEDWEFRTYSGRYMYGRECIALVTDASPWAIVKSLAGIAADFAGEPFGDETALLLAEPDTDAMGMGTVYYWRHVSLDTDAEEE